MDGSRLLQYFTHHYHHSACIISVLNSTSANNVQSGLSSASSVASSTEVVKWWVILHSGQPGGVRMSCRTFPITLRNCRMNSAGISWQIHFFVHSTARTKNMHLKESYIAIAAKILLQTNQSPLISMYENVFNTGPAPDFKSSNTLHDRNTHSIAGISTTFPANFPTLFPFCYFPGFPVISRKVPKCVWRSADLDGVASFLFGVSVSFSSSIFVRDCRHCSAVTIFIFYLHRYILESEAG